MSQRRQRGAVPPNPTFNTADTYCLYDFESNALYPFAPTVVKPALDWYLDSIGLSGSRFYLGVVANLEENRISHRVYNTLWQTGFPVHSVGVLGKNMQISDNFIKQRFEGIRRMVEEKDRRVNVVLLASDSDYLAWLKFFNQPNYVHVEVILIYKFGVSSSKIYNFPCPRIEWISMLRQYSESQIPNPQAPDVPPPPSHTFDPPPHSSTYAHFPPIEDYSPFDAPRPPRRGGDLPPRGRGRGRGRQARTGPPKAVTSVLVPLGFDGSLVRPFMKRYLETYGYIGALTITAFGVSGHVHICPFTELIQLSGARRLRADFQTALQSADDLVPDEETGESPYWDCVACRRDPPAEVFENFISHLASEEHLDLTFKRTPRPREYHAVPTPRVSHLPEIDYHAVHDQPFFMQSSRPCEIDYEAVTSVYWDIRTSPVRRLVGPTIKLFLVSLGRLVGPTIKRFLGSLGYSGTLTITAVGVLTDVPIGILRAVYSSGIALVNVPHGSQDIPYIVNEFIISKPPPANIMLISDPKSGVPGMLPQTGYNLLFQHSLPKDSGALEDKCSETDSSLQEQFNKDLSLAEAETIAVSILKQVMEEKVTPNNVDIAKVAPAYHLYTPQEVACL